MWGFVACIIAVLAILIGQWVRRWWDTKTSNGNVRLPPGSLGFPIIGETIQFLCNHSFTDIPPFIRKRMSKSLREEFLHSCFLLFQEGQSVYCSYPESFTAYHECVKGREKAMKVIKDVIDERKSSKRAHRDFLDFLLEEAKKEDKILNEAILADLVFDLLFASYETTSLAITLAIKFLSDHPSVAVELTKEHEEIVRNREKKEAGITWAEYKSMSFTHMVINQTFRLGNIIPVIFREVAKDIDRNGIRIPVGTTVMLCPPAVHLNPGKYEDPLTFDPWRWEGQELKAWSKDFTAFGGGARHCPGTHFSKAQIAVFLHYLVTNYRWKKISGGEIIRKPGLVFPYGLRIQISRKDIQIISNERKQ